jgi:hypothetical protein
MDTQDQGGGSSDNPYNYRTMRGLSSIDLGQRFVVHPRPRGLGSSR